NMPLCSSLKHSPRYI
ncbi:hypothetical protein AB1N83_013822, partial [Pleurotus pulmonarius]